MKKRIVSIFLVLVSVLSVPVAFICIGFFTPPQFDETYYGELSFMYKRLQNTQDRKIVIISNSAVAFGVRSDLFEQELLNENVVQDLHGFRVVNFGLYAALGTKAMLDLAKDYINSGDIVIIAPELNEQSMSLYFSASEFWRAADSDFSMISKVIGSHGSALTGNFFGFVSDKYKYILDDEGPSSSGAYSQSAFNNEYGEEVGYMTFNREYNIMLGGYNTIFAKQSFREIIGNGFIDYLNHYAAAIKNKGAAVYYGFTPMNLFALPDNYSAELNDLYDYLLANLRFDILGHPEKYVLDYEWFYDNDAHMNSSGMFVYTYLLCEDLKIAYNDYSKINIAIPQKPEIPIGEVINGDNSDANLFSYEITEFGINLTALKNEAKQRSSITLPTSYDGINVVSFSESVFAGNNMLNQIIIPATIREIRDYSFKDCSKLTRIIMKHDDLITCKAGDYFLAGTRNDCYIYVSETAYKVVQGCTGGWLNYSKRIKPYFNNVF